jgi:hypothetical protein
MTPDRNPRYRLLAVGPQCDPDGGHPLGSWRYALCHWPGSAVEPFSSHRLWDDGSGLSDGNYFRTLPAAAADWLKRVDTFLKAEDRVIGLDPLIPEVK